MRRVIELDLGDAIGQAVINGKIGSGDEVVIGVGTINDKFVVGKETI